MIESRLIGCLHQEWHRAHLILNTKKICFKIDTEKTETVAVVGVEITVSSIESRIT